MATDVVSRSSETLNFRTQAAQGARISKSVMDSLRSYMALSSSHSTTMKTPKVAKPPIKQAIHSVQVAQPAHQVDSSKLKSASLPNIMEKPLNKTRDPEAPKGDIYARIYKDLLDIKEKTGHDLNHFCEEMELRSKTIEDLLKLNGELIKKGPIDFSDKEEFKRGIDKLRLSGLLSIPEGKYSWTEDEKDTLKVQIANAKERCEKLSQEIQFKLQKATTEDSVIWETISMVFKRWAQVLDTIISNLRGH